jgi:hypothetical protein
MKTVIASSDYPFHWQGKEYQIGECGIVDGTPYAKVSPENPLLVDEMKRRILRDNTLKLYYDGGFTRFPDDS